MKKIDDELLIVTDKIIYQFRNDFYTTGGFLFQIKGFLNYFDKVGILTRVIKVDKLQKEFLKMDKDIKIFCLESNYFSLKNFYKNMKDIKRLAKNYKYVHLRLPSITGVIFGLQKINHKYVKVYVGGHPEKGILNAKGKNLLTYIVSKIYKSTILKITSKNETYVTGNELKAYFNSHGVEVEKIISSSITEKDIVNIYKNKPDKNNEVLNMVFVGRLSKEKGLIFLIESLSELKIGFNLHIIGEGPLKEDLISKVTNLDLSGKVKFHGGIYERNRLYEILDQMDIFVLTSITEGTPKVIMEAMARGLPVVCSNVGGIPSIVENNVNGYTFDYGDSEDFNNKLLKLDSNCAIYELFSKNGIAFARNNSLEHLNKKLMNYPY